MLNTGGKLLAYLPIMSCEVGQNKKVVAALQPPSCLGYFSPSLAPRGIEPQAGQGLLIFLRFNLDSGCRRIKDTANIFSIDRF